MDMDYKKIELLLEKYWQAETSLEEEKALRDFFSNESAIPAHLLPYRAIFAYQKSYQQVGLGEEFDNRMLRLVEQKPVRMRVVSWRMRLIPLFKGAAVLAGIVLLGNLAQWTYRSSDQIDYDYDCYVDTYDDPEAALKQVSSALQIVSEGLSKSALHEPDSTVVQTVVE